MRILLVEDDATLGSAVRDYLTRDSYAVDLVDRLASARACLPGNYSVVVLDLGLPDGDGLSLLPAIFKQPEPPSVLVLTAQDRLSDRVRGLDAGADDYLVKPFDLPELAARLRALVRRRAGRHAPRIELGPVTIDPVTREVTLAGTPVELTAQEYALVVAFAEQPRRVLTRGQLEDAIYTLDGGALSNVVEVYVSRLRRKFGRDSIRTVRGVGYRWGVAGGVDGEADA
jgi:DNA-binding response OmpR family regulator